MVQKFLVRSILLLMLPAAVLAGCVIVPITGNNGQPSDAIFTQAAQTVQAMITQTYFPPATNTSEQPTAGPQPTNTLLPPTATPTVTPTLVPPTPTATPAPCDWAQFVSDVTIPDGTILQAGSAFTKTWRLKNIGDCTWQSNYALVFSSGASMGDTRVVNLGATVKPGGEVDVSVLLTAPATAGDYQGFWMLRNASGNLFGLGANAAKAFWVKITVNAYHSEAVPASKYPLDFVANLCQASWSADGDHKVTLPCPNVASTYAYWVAVSNAPKFESGRVENERTLVIHMPASSQAWMQGFYPVYTVKSGDHFVTDIGCMFGNEGCNVQFGIDIRVDNGPVQHLAKYPEKYDGKITAINIDLSPYVGKSVQFILGVSNLSSSSPADVFWFTPAVINVP